MAEERGLQQAGGAIVIDVNATLALHKKGISATDDSFKFICLCKNQAVKLFNLLCLNLCHLCFFQDHESERNVIYTGSEFWESASGVGGDIVLESISFYAEQGGNLIGKCHGFYFFIVIEGPFGLFQVCDVQIFGGFILHIDSLTAESGRFSTGDKVICKEVLDNHVDRKGSTILLEKLRFDFSHGKPVDPELLRKIESIVNGQIKDELDVFAKETALTEAKQINSLRAVFGEVSLAALFALY
ncbi:hypothetical protein NC652_019181 [Populus alba x Populus x berolinensis]|nr:hypothetical protein NC652_019181 [Populus alba x Populus x berolinensis]